MTDPFAADKGVILSQFLLHHPELAPESDALRMLLDKVVARVVELHQGQHRATGEEYVWHLLRTAVTLSGFGRIVDWSAIEAAILHDTLEDTPLTKSKLREEFPESAGIVEALTKIRDSKSQTYERLFRHALTDIRVLLIKICDRLHNLETLGGIKSERKRRRIALESRDVYGGICRKLCMMDLADQIDRLTAPALYSEAELNGFAELCAQAEAKWKKFLDRFEESLRTIFGGDLPAQWRLEWQEFTPGAAMGTEDLLCCRVVTPSKEDAYRALGRVHAKFRCLSGEFRDSISAPRGNNYRSLETMVRAEGHLMRFSITTEKTERFNHRGVLSLDLSAADLQSKYLADLTRLYQEGGEVSPEDVASFHRQDSIEVFSPAGDAFNLPDGATVLDFAFALHGEILLDAVGARVNDEKAPLGRRLRSGDWVEIIRAQPPLADERKLSWLTSSSAKAALRRHLRVVDARKSAEMGQVWFSALLHAEGIPAEDGDVAIRQYAEQRDLTADEVYRRLFFDEIKVDALLGREASSGFPWNSLRRWQRKATPVRRVKRYDFEEPNIRFCSACVPVEGDEILGVREGDKLIVHGARCLSILNRPRISLAWDKPSAKGPDTPLAPMELHLTVENRPNLLRELLDPFKGKLLLLDVKPRNAAGVLVLTLEAEGKLAMNELLKSLRKHKDVQEIRVFRVFSS